MDENHDARPSDWIEPTVMLEEEAPAEIEEESEALAEEEPPNDQAMEKLYQGIERKSANYAKAQTAQLAETGLPWETCPCCGVAGFVLPFNPDDPDEQMRRLTVFDYFDANEPAYKEATDRTECPACEGWGQVLSGSKAPQHRVVPCSRCNGTGYTGVTPAYHAAEANGAEIPQGIPAPHEPGAQQAQPDYWGRPPGHRDYGTLPSLVNA
jgi:hypothetical protein